MPKSQLNSNVMGEEMEKSLVLQLTVNNHPGVMSHVCGLFARKAYNLEGILCMPIEQGTYSKIWLRVCDQNRLDQIVKQLQKLEDVHAVSHTSIIKDDFVRLKQFFNLGACK